MLRSDSLQGLTDPTGREIPEPELFPPTAVQVSSNLKTEYIDYGGQQVGRIRGEFWSAAQRQASSLHEISYRACFKPQLPRYFIERYTQPGDLVYDPFMGRGTTIIESALLRRSVAGNDANPLSRILTLPRLEIPAISDIDERLRSVQTESSAKADLDLSMFYHPRTEAELVSLRNLLLTRQRQGKDDSIDRWIQMVATNRLTGHSAGFFSVYTLPPNQAASQENQKRINRQRKQEPPYRDVRALIMKKTRSLLRTVSHQERRRLREIAENARFFSGDARKTSAIPDEAVQLTVTSPPFLDIVDYSNDNWLRCWFNGLDQKLVTRALTKAASLEEWRAVMKEVFEELFRLTRAGGYVAFEVGEVRKGRIQLDEHVVPLGIASGFSCESILLNEQKFTKTSNIWGIRNNKEGTNSNRIVLFRK